MPAEMDWVKPFKLILNVATPLSFDGVNEARQFEKALKRRVKAILNVEKESVVV